MNSYQGVRGGVHNVSTHRLYKFDVCRVGHRNNPRGAECLCLCTAVESKRESARCIHAQNNFEARFIIMKEFGYKLVFPELYSLNHRVIVCSGVALQCVAL